jgi:hypothetical protein
MPSVPVPEFSVRAAFVAVSVMPPEPDVNVTEVAPVALPKVLTLAPVVASVVAPTDVSVVPAAMDVVEVIEPGATRVAERDKVSVLAEPVVVIWLRVPSRLKLPPPSGTSAPPASPVKLITAPDEPAPARFHVAAPANTLPRNQFVPAEVLVHC